MIARVATFQQLNPDELDAQAVERLRRTIKSTPGFIAGFHLRNPETGKAVSFTVYESPEALAKVGEALVRRNDDERVGIAGRGRRLLGSDRVLSRPGRGAAGCSPC
jgi:hypothetical protein